MVRTTAGFRATDEAVPAFRRPYLIRESMSYGRESEVTSDELDRFKRALVWEGFNEFEMVVKTEKPGKKLTPERQAQIDVMLARLGFDAPF